MRRQRGAPAASAGAGRRCDGVGASFPPIQIGGEGEGVGASGSSGGLGFRARGDKVSVWGGWAFGLAGWAVWPSWPGGFPPIFFLIFFLRVYIISVL